MQAYTDNMAGRVSAHVKTMDKDGGTPLHDAARAGSANAIRELVCSGADVDARDKDSRTPLHDAVQAGSKTAIHQLVNKGANVNAGDKEGLTPFPVVVTFSSQKEDARLLLKGGAYPSNGHDCGTISALVEEIYMADRENSPEISKIYKSLPLSSTIEEIRTVTIQPGRGNEPMTLTLENSDLLQSKYTALSYMWGYKTPSLLPRKLWDESRTEIQCKGPSHEVSHKVTPNLYAALHQLRHLKDPKVLWIDAICINQKDDHEKTGQLKLMGKIYTRAERTVVWLGEETYTSSLGFKAIRFLSPIVLHRLNPQHETQGQALQKPSGFFRSQAFCWRLIFYTGAFIWLLQNPYFARVWIIQEIALSQDLEFQLGPECVSMRQFESAAATLSTIDFGNKTSRTLSHILAIRSLVRLHPKASSEDVSRKFRQVLGERLDLERGIFSIMSLFRGSHATNKIDKIFGLLGLCRELENAQTLGIEENCGLNERDAYIRAAVSILKSKRDLGLFAALSLQPGGGSIATLPSWVPDVRIPPRVSLRSSDLLRELPVERH
jgi:hypothetical protein